MGIILAIWSFLAVRHQRRDILATQNLIETVRKEEPNRFSQICDALNTVHQSVNSTAVATQLLEEERNFYRHFIQIYLKRDPATIAKLPGMIKKLADSYQKLFVTEELNPPLNAHPPTVQDFSATYTEQNNDFGSIYSQRGVEQSVQYLGEEPKPVAESPPPYLGEENPLSSPIADELQLLRAKREKLKEHLQVTLDTMHKMIEEYAHLYGKECLTLTRTTIDQILEALLMVSDDELQPILPESDTKEENTSEKLAQDNPRDLPILAEEPPVAEITPPPTQPPEDIVPNEPLDFDALQLEEISVDLAADISLSAPRLDESKLFTIEDKSIPKETSDIRNEINSTAVPRNRH